MLELLEEHRCFGGRQLRYQHFAPNIGLPMRFSIYLPPASRFSGAAVLYLAGLTCNDENFIINAGAQAHAAQAGLVLIAPDTSPRGANLAGESESWDFGLGAGFYLDATQSPWRSHYRMESYLLEDLLPSLITEFSLDKKRIGIMGHSMGGHGALSLALRHPGVFKSLSAFSAICAPSLCPWGQKSFNGYLGPRTEALSSWLQHDSSALMQGQSNPPYPQGILLDFGLADPFLNKQLMPEHFETACNKVGQTLQLRRLAGYDHSYFFIQSFIADHIAHHRLQLD